MQLLGVLAFVLALQSLLMNGVVAAEKESTVASSSLEVGRAIYNFRCYFCHGYNGDAETVASTFLRPPPKNFKKLSIDALPRKQMMRIVSDGRPGTAMKGFSRILSEEEVGAVVDFVRITFMQQKEYNLSYHTPVNGWFDGARSSPAAPFALGEVPLDTPDHQLSDQLRYGKQVYMQSCISCHDRMRKNETPVVWDKRAVSYPRAGHSHRPEEIVDSLTGATPYAEHDIPPVIDDLTSQEKKGETLFLINCAFCHGATGTGKNWIGTFLEPHPRDLTDEVAMKGMTKRRLKEVILKGLPGTTMPAWRAVLSEQEIDEIIAYINRAFYAMPDA